MSYTVTIQARLSSSRLPGKVLKKIGELNVLEVLIKRLKKSKKINDIIVATTEKKKDDLLVEFCKKKKIRYFRGSENDVLNRICSCLKKNKIINHIELFADSPLVDPELIDSFIEIFKKEKLDFLSNSNKTTYPAGMEINIYKPKILYFINKQIHKNSPLREHAISNLKNIKSKGKFRIKYLSAPKKYKYPNIYFEIDTMKDFKFFKEMYKANREFYKLNLSQLIEIVLKFKLNRINSKVFRRWKKFRKD